jgi:hypothetical protein
VDLAGVVHPAEDVRGGAGIDRAAETVSEAAVDLGGHGARSEGLAVVVALDDGWKSTDVLDFIPSCE